MTSSSCKNLMMITGMIRSCCTPELEGPYEATSALAVDKIFDWRSTTDGLGINHYNEDYKDWEVSVHGVAAAKMEQLFSTSETVHNIVINMGQAVTEACKGVRLDKPEFSHSILVLRADVKSGPSHWFTFDVMGNHDDANELRAGHKIHANFRKFGEVDESGNPPLRLMFCAGYRIIRYTPIGAGIKKTMSEVNDWLNEHIWKTASYHPLPPSNARVKGVKGNIIRRMMNSTTSKAQASMSKHSAAEKESPENSPLQHNCKTSLRYICEKLFKVDAAIVNAVIM